MNNAFQNEGVDIRVIQNQEKYKGKYTWNFIFNNTCKKKKNHDNNYDDDNSLTKSFCFELIPNFLLCLLHVYMYS